MSWQQAWKEGRTPWDQGASSPVLAELVRADAVPHGRGLVPGAGSGYDVLTLASDQRHVVGIDLADHAVQRFKALREQAGIDADIAQMQTADFFEYEDDPFDFIWDYTFLCAIEPEQRATWRDQVVALLKPRAALFVLVFPTVPLHDDPKRPPHVLSVELVGDILGPEFRLELARKVPNSMGNRRGREILTRWTAPDRAD